jgi:hypothetical protein
MHLPPEVLGLQFRLCSDWECEVGLGFYLHCISVGSLAKDSAWHLISLGRVLFPTSLGTNIKKNRGTHLNSTLFSLDLMLTVCPYNSFQT